MSHNIAILAARASFTTFLDLALPQMIHNYQHFPYFDLLGARMEDLILHQKAGRLAINLPPRHGKSFMIVALAAWFLGLYPTKEILLIVHSHSLAVDIAGKLHQLMDSALFQESFPDLTFQAGRESMTDFRTNLGGGFKAGSIDSNITGRGADLLLIDDILPAQDTNSVNARSFVRNTYDSTIATRLNNQENGKIISMSHRLHTEDLTGHLLGLGFEHLKLPFAATENEVYSVGGVTFRRNEGDILQPNRLSLESSKRSVSSHVFETQYQQSPTAAGMGKLNRANFPIVTVCPSGGRDIISWDLASSLTEGSSYSVGVHFHQMENAAYIKQIVRGRFNYTRLRERALYLHNTFKPIHLVEAASLGAALIDDLRQAGATVVEVKVGNQSKEQRVEAVVNKIEDGYIHPVADIAHLQEYLDEMTSFPYGSNDDLVDATTQFLIWLRETAPVRKHPCVTIGTTKSRGLYRNGLISRYSRGQRD